MDFCLIVRRKLRQMDERLKKNNSPFTPTSDAVAALFYCVKTPLLNDISMNELTRSSLSGVKWRCD